MKIRWYGGSALLFQAKHARIILGWPETPDSTIELKSEDLLVLPQSQLQLSPQYQASIEQKNVFVIDSPGEYSYHGVTILAQAITKQDIQKIVVASLSIDGMVVASLMNIDRELQGKELDTVARTDILALPVGGGDVLTYKAAVKIVNQIEPRVVLPLHFQTERDTEKDPLHVFLKEYGLNTEPVDEVVMKKGDLPFDRTDIIALNVSKV